jgi:STE24 endopeptidase
MIHNSPHRHEETMNHSISRFICLLILSICLGSGILFAQQTPGAAPLSTTMPTVFKIPPEAQPSPHFDAEAATRAYLAEIPAEAKARSDAYFEGGYWLVLWDFLVGAIILFLVLHLRWSAAMRNVAERVTRFKPVHTFVYWVEFLVLTTLLGFPLTVYEGYFREHKYGLATQTFGPWLNDQFKDLLVGLVLGGILVVVLFGLVRRLIQTWWIWGAVVTLVFMMFVVLIAPVYLVPIFNKVTRLDDPRITAPILRLARANGIPAHDVYTIDASRQSTRMSANVSGFANTLRITLNDNLLRRGSPEEIQAVMGHEMGHYILGHAYSGILFFGVVIVIGFALLRWALDISLKRWGEKWQIRNIGDPAVLPLVVLLGSIFFFILTPLMNTYSRTDEFQADMFGLNAARQPDGFAQAALHLAEYRKMEPGPIEEWIFYDHPSGRNRIYAAMRWKAENLQLFSAPADNASAPGSPKPDNPPAPPGKSAQPSKP